MTAAVVASMLVNVGTVLSVSAMTVAASASFIAAGFTGFGVLANFVKVSQWFHRLWTEADGLPFWSHYFDHKESWLCKNAGQGMLSKT